MIRTQPIEILVFGADTPCPSCVNGPSSRETADWLEAALGRKYGGQITVRYIDIEHPEGEEETAFASRVLNGEFFYPVVVIGSEVVAEGDPKLKVIQTKLEALGAVPTGLR